MDHDSSALEAVMAFGRPIEELHHAGVALNEHSALLDDHDRVGQSELVTREHLIQPRRRDRAGEGECRGARRGGPRDILGLGDEAWSDQRESDSVTMGAFWHVPTL